MLFFERCVMSDDKIDYLAIMAQRAADAKNRISDAKSNSQPESEVTSKEDIIVVDVINLVSYKSDIDSLNYPIFALSKNISTAEITYSYKNVKLTVTPNSYGRATMFDKDVWIYCISKLAQAIYENNSISPTIRFKMTDFLRTVGRSINGRSHMRAKDAFDRLDGTRVKLEIKEGQRIVTQKFGLLEGWKTIENEKGEMEYVQVTLPQWVFESIVNGDLKKISSKFFSLTRSIERRIYEIAAKYCNKNAQWAFSLSLLKERCGSTDTLKSFRQNVKEIAKTGKIPDYKIVYEAETDKVIFINLDPKIQEKAAKKEAQKKLEILVDNVTKKI